MKKPHLLNHLLLLAFSTAPAVSSAKTEALAKGEERTATNVVLLLVDDLGYADIGANNPDTFYATPHIDRLASEGVRFTNGYAVNPVCSPTRFSIMTGKYPSRHDATNFFSGKREGRFKPAPLNNFMPLEEVTVAEALHAAGYKTCFVGKWHLGETEAFWPTHQGFDENIGGWKRGAPKSFFSPYHNPKLTDGPDGEYLPERLASDSVKFMDANKENPFFLFLSFYSVHTPLQARKAEVTSWKEKVAALPDTSREPAFAEEEQVWPDAGTRKVRVKQTHATYAAMVSAMDAAVGTVLEGIESLGLTDDTLVILTSDNGGLSTSEGSPTSNLPLRGGKGWLYEGGIREPFLIRWPAGQATGRTCDFPVASTDLYPTILDVCGIDALPEQHLDGTSLTPLLRDPGSTLSRKALFWHYPHYSNQGGFPGGAIRIGNWKVIERYEDGRAHLYDLAADIGERNDLATAHPDIVSSMRSKLHAWYREVDAKFLQPKDGKTPWMPGQQ